MKAKHRDSRQGCYLAITRSGKLYIGSVAGGRGRSFATRQREHERDIASGAHPNDTLRREGLAELRPLVVVKRGDIALARKVEGVIIRALRKAVCNERK